MQVKSVTTICTIQIRMSPVIIWLQICEEVKHYHFRKATILTWILIMTGLKMQNFTGQKMKFYINCGFQGTADLVTFTEEICNGKLHFLCSV